MATITDIERSDGPEKYRSALTRLDRYAELMDARFKVPCTEFRVGLDALIGLVPGVGDAIGLLLSLYIVAEAIRIDVARRVVLGMLFNIGLEAVIGVVPVLGDLFDAAFKANLRNTALLRAHIEEQLKPPEVTPPRWKQWLLVAAFALLMVAVGAMAYGFWAGGARNLRRDTAAPS